MNRNEILGQAISTYGKDAQTDMMIEEMSELTKAIIKYRRSYVGAERTAALGNILEEIADVQIMLDQMRLIYGDTVEQDAYKLERLAGRLSLRLEG